jgi:hypothetical protein
VLDEVRTSRPVRHEAKNHDVGFGAAAIMLSSVLANTAPNPRWLRSKHVSKASIARTPVPMGSAIPSRSRGFNASGRSGAIPENSIGPRAYRPQAVVRAINGTTIQVIHSDAEGRMVLADTLALAARSKPRMLLDFATLTGACVYADLTDFADACRGSEDSIRRPTALVT